MGPWLCRSRPTVTPDRSGVLLQFLGVALQVLEPTAHEERLLGEVVVLALADLLERLDGLLERDRRAGHAGELLRRVGVLRQEALDPARAVDAELVLLGQLVHAEDGD